MSQPSRRVLVSGGASGIGLATVEAFLENGDAVFVIDKDSDAVDRLNRSRTRRLHAVVGDVSEPASVNAAFEEMDSWLEGVDVLIANAGVSCRRPFLEIPFPEWNRVLSTNLDGVFHCAQAAGRRMAKQGSGVMLFMGSTNGLVGYPFYAGYNASKAAVIELGRSIALELAPTVRVNTVCPGYVMTPMQLAEYSPAMIQAVNDRIPLRRHATPREIADLFLFLASDRSRFMTGQAIVIDGGELAGGLASGGVEGTRS